MSSTMDAEYVVFGTPLVDESTGNVQTKDDSALVKTLPVWKQVVLLFRAFC